MQDEKRREVECGLEIKTELITEGRSEATHSSRVPFTQLGHLVEKYAQSGQRFVGPRRCQQLPAPSFLREKVESLLPASKARRRHLGLHEMVIDAEAGKGPRLACPLFGEGQAPAGLGVPSCRMDENELLCGVNEPHARPGRRGLS